LGTRKKTYSTFANQTQENFKAQFTRLKFKLHFLTQKSGFVKILIHVFVQLICFRINSEKFIATMALDRAVGQAASRLLPSVATRVRIRAGCGVCVGQSGTGAGFLRVLRFTLPIISQISPSS
jgi:hypothetical protein